MYRVVYDLNGVRESESFGNERDMGLFLITLPEEAYVVQVGYNVGERHAEQRHTRLIH